MTVVFLPDIILMKLINQRRVNTSLIQDFIVIINQPSRNEVIKNNAHKNITAGYITGNLEGKCNTFYDLFLKPFSYILRLSHSNCCNICVLEPL